jgi:DNA replication protein DnaC
VNKREQNGLIERINVAHFPVFKELADFFSALPMLNKAQVLDLARGKYISKRVSIVFIGNPGLGKTHFALALALSACRQVPASQNVC